LSGAFKGQIAQPSCLEAEVTDHGQAKIRKNRQEKASSAQIRRSGEEKACEKGQAGISQK
jgi:hypothetical protein